MILTEKIKFLLLQEIVFSTSRSSGPGGQNVNKVESKVILRFNILESKILSVEDKKRAMTNLKNKLSEGNTLILASSLSRSQSKNKEDVIHKFYLLLEEALKIPKPRKKTKPSVESKEKRLQAKTRRSEIKEGRRKVIE